MNKQKGLSTTQLMLVTGAISVGGAGYITAVPTSAEITAQNYQVASQMFSQIEDAALNDYVKKGAWSSNIDTLINNKAYFGTKVSPYGTLFTTTPNPDGSYTIQMTAKNNVQAKQIANMIGNGTVAGNTVSKKVGTPAEGALRNSLLSDYVDITSTSQLKFQTDINMNGKDLLGLSQLEAGQVIINGAGIIFPTTSIKETGANQLTINAGTTSFTDAVNVAGTLKAKDADITNSIKASLATLSQVNATNLKAQNVTTTDAAITDAEIQRLVANSANLKTATAETLTVSGLTKLADLVANNATFNGVISSKELNISGKGIVTLLEADGIDVNNANITRAEVANLLGNVANISQLTSTLISTKEARIGTGVVTNLTSTNAALENLTSNLVTAKLIDVEGLKAVNAELESATAKTLNVLGVATFKNLNSDYATIKTVNADTVNSDIVNAKNVNVSGKTTTKQLHAESATIGTLTVGNTLTTKTLNVTTDAVVGGTLSAKSANVTSNLTVGENTQTGSLSVTNNATLNTASANDISANDVTVAQMLTTKAANVTNNLTVGGNLKTTSLAAGSANITGALTTNTVQATSAQLTNVRAATVGVTGTTSTRDLVVSALATMQTANISNLVAQISNIGTATGTNLSLSGNLAASKGVFTSVITSGLGSFGSLDVTGNATIRGPLTVQSDISARNLNLSGTLTASGASLGSLNSNSISATGNVTGTDVKTSAGASLNSLKAGYEAHEGRIMTMEQWVAKCKAKQTPECNR